VAQANAPGVEHYSWSRRDRGVVPSLVLTASLWLGLNPTATGQSERSRLWREGAA